jgi:hypothetical protein
MLDGLRDISQEQAPWKQTDSRDEFILESTQEKNGSFQYLRQNIFTGPVLMTETSEVPCWGENTGSELESCQKQQWEEYILWNQLANA